MPTDAEKDKGTNYSCKLCLKEHVTWRCLRLQECTDYLAKKDSGKASAVLKNPFPSQQQQNLVANQLQPMSKGSDGSQHPLASEGSSIVYTFETVELTTRAKSYGAFVASVAEPSSGQNPSPPKDLHIERPVEDFLIRPPKGALRRTMDNTSTRAAQHYNIVEDLVQASSTMLVLEVLQTCPTPRKALLSAIGGIDPMDSMLAIFDMDKCKPPISRQLAF